MLTLNKANEIITGLGKEGKIVMSFAEYKKQTGRPGTVIENWHTVVGEKVYSEQTTLDANYEDILLNEFDITVISKEEYQKLADFLQAQLLDVMNPFKKNGRKKTEYNINSQRNAIKDAQAKLAGIDAIY